MEAVFLKLLNMSIAAGWLVLAVMLLRPLLGKAPKAIRCVLWALVGIRLVCPVSIESVLSLIPSAETVPREILYADTPTIHSGISALNQAVNPVISQSLAPQAGDSVNPMQVLTGIASVAWLIGMLVMLVYTLVSFLRIRLRVREATPLQDNIWLCDRIPTPFVLGILRPRIYLPSAMRQEDRAYVIAHENAHLRRRDHWWKPLGFLLLTVHWFNPLLWVAYVLLCRDIELACDERVIRELGADNKKPYADALINCSVPRRMIAACPLAFGEVGVKRRIKTVLHYRKPAFWLVVAAAIACVAVAVCFLTDPKGERWQSDNYGITGLTIAAECDDVEYRYRYGTIKEDWPYISVEWVNNTDDTLCYGEEFVLYKEDELYAPAKEMGWDAVLHTVLPGGTAEEIYSLAAYDLSGSGSYRLEKEFYLQSDPDTKYRAYISFGIDRRYSFIGRHYTGEKIIYENGSFSSVLYTDENIPQFVINDGDFHLLTSDWPQATLSSAMYDIGELQKITLKKSNFDDFLTREQWDSGYSAAALRKNNLNAFYVMDTDGRGYYLLEQKNGEIYIAQGYTETGLLRWIFKMRPRIDSSSLVTEPSAEEVYACTDSPDPLAPTLRLWPDIKQFTFTYSSLSSHQPRGSYQEEGDRLILRDETTDAVYKFMKVRDGYIFDMYESTALPSYRYEAGGEPQQPVASSALFRPLTAVSADTVAYTAYPVVSVAWQEDDSIYTTALNADTMHISSVRHLPIFRMESVQELEAFRTAHASRLTIKFDQATAQFDETFFAKNTLLLVYVSSATCSETYVVEQVYGDGNSLCVGVYGNPYGSGDTALGTWMLPLAVSKETAAACTSFDAVLNHTIYATETTTGTAHTVPEAVGIPFSVGVYKNLRASDNDVDFEARILRSYQELVAFYNADTNPNKVNYMEGYNEAFFEENAVLLLSMKRTSGSVRDRVDSLTRQGDRLTVAYTTVTPSKRSADMAYWRLLLEVKQADVEGVTEILSQQAKQILPSGQAIPDDLLAQ